VAARIHIPRGTVAYHVRVLRETGLVYVADTRRVRAVTERYYARTPGSYVNRARSDLPAADCRVVDKFLADYGGCSGITADNPAMRVVRISRAQAGAFTAELNRLLATFSQPCSEAGDNEPLGAIAGVYWLHSRR
jgi:hypothetical protein